jgi:hypothetical protein
MYKFDYMDSWRPGMRCFERDVSFAGDGHRMVYITLQIRECCKEEGHCQDSICITYSTVCPGVGCVTFT